MSDEINSVYANVKNPLVSIVTPTYNQADFIRETFDSVFNQTYPCIEYIVLNDGSTDNTEEIIKKEKRLAVGETQLNMGQSRTLNKGWEMARGKYIGYLSSDDLIYPKAVEKLVAILEANDNIVCVFPDSDLIDVESKIIKKNICRKFDLQELILNQECYIGPGALFRRDIFLEIGGWDSTLKLAPDREFWIRLACRGQIVMLEETLAGYRMHQQSISYKDVSEETSREYIRVLDRYYAGELGTILPTLVSRKEEAYANATLIIARNCLRAWQIKRGLQLYSDACNLYLPLKSYRTKLKLLRNVASKPTRILMSKLKKLMKVS